MPVNVDSIKTYCIALFGIDTSNLMDALNYPFRVDTGRATLSPEHSRSHYIPNLLYLEAYLFCKYVDILATTLDIQAIEFLSFVRHQVQLSLKEYCKKGAVCYISTTHDPLSRRCYVPKYYNLNQHSFESSYLLYCWKKTTNSSIYNDYYLELEKKNDQMV